MRAGRNAAMGESSRGGERSIRRRNRAGGLLDVLLSFPSFLSNSQKLAFSFSPFRPGNARRRSSRFVQQRSSTSRYSCTVVLFSTTGIQPVRHLTSSQDFDNGRLWPGHLPDLRYSASAYTGKQHSISFPQHGLVCYFSGREARP